MMRSHAVRAGRVRSLWLLLIVLNGCGAQRCQGSAASGDTARSAAVAGSPLPAAPAAIPAVESPPAPAAALVPRGGEGSEAAAEEGSGSADEGSGIPPGMPEEGSPAYERLVARLCASFLSDHEFSEFKDCGNLSGGTNGAPRTYEVSFYAGCVMGICSIKYTEQPDGTWQGGEEECREGTANVEQVTMNLRPEIALAARHPSDIEVAAAKAELEKQGLSSDDEVEFIDLNHDGQTEFIEWYVPLCVRIREPHVYLRGPDGRWVEDSDAADIYFTWPEDE